MPFGAFVLTVRLRVKEAVKEAVEVDTSGGE